MRIYGGRAGFNSVSFTGEKYQSVSELKKNNITTYINQNKKEDKITVFLSGIPFLRSFSLCIKLILERWKQILLTFIFLFLLEFLLNVKLDSNFLFITSTNTLVSMSIFLFLVSLIIKITPVCQLHGAEHMVANAYVKDSNLTLEKVKKQSRIHIDCGTNLVVSIFICFSILFMIFGDEAWVFLVSWMIGYEIWKCETKIIWNVVLLVGKAMQYLLVTSKPKEKHLLVAIEAIKKLEEKELATNKLDSPT